MHDDAVPDDVLAVRPQHAARQQVERVGLAVDDQAVPRVRAAVEPRDDVGAAGEDVDELALALVAPLRAEHHDDPRVVAARHVLLFPSQALDDETGGEAGGAGGEDLGLAVHARARAVRCLRAARKESKESVGSRSALLRRDRDGELQLLSPMLAARPRAPTLTGRRAIRLCDRREPFF